MITQKWDNLTDGNATVDNTFGPWSTHMYAQASLCYLCATSKRDQGAAGALSGGSSAGGAGSSSGGGGGRVLAVVG
jgi:uncharacterized membrane protein YgcG